jgi:integrase
MLTDTAVRKTKPRAKPYKLPDGKGLNLLVNPDGTRWWRLRYRYAGKEKMLSFGGYPEVSLSLARDKRDDARKLLARGIDPSAQKQAEKAAEKLANADTFEALALEWLTLTDKPDNGAMKSGTVRQLKRRLKTYVFPHIGNTPIAQVAAPELLKILRKIESKGTLETAHRVRAVVSRVFRFAVATGRADRDPAGDLKGALAPVRTTNFAAITDPRKVGGLLRAIDGYQGQPAVAAALKLAPLVFVRPAELRGALWPEFDLDGAEWRLPSERTKMGDAHIVPLSKQAVAILRELHRLTGRGEHVFPGLRPKRPISENTTNAALRAMGFSGDQQTTHGFRTIASTLLNELGFPTDVIELQLQHRERNKVRAAYNKAERLAERRAMMQSWADYLDGLKSQ